MSKYITKLETLLDRLKKIHPEYFTDEEFEVKCRVCYKPFSSNWRLSKHCTLEH